MKTMLPSTHVKSINLKNSLLNVPVVGFLSSSLSKFHRLVELYMVVQISKTDPKVSAGQHIVTSTCPRIFGPIVQLAHTKVHRCKKLCFILTYLQGNSGAGEEQAWCDHCSWCALQLWTTGNHGGSFYCAWSIQLYTLCNVYKNYFELKCPCSRGDALRQKDMHFWFFGLPVFLM